MATVLGANTLSTGSFDVANSVRMNRGSTEHLRRTNNTGETSNKIGTYSGWVKRSTIALDGMMFEGKDLDANNYTQIYFQATGKLTVYGSGSSDIVSTALFKDPTAWYHVCVAIDTTQGTAANRVKIYVNGVQLTSLTNGNGDAADYPDQNDVIYFAVNGDQQAIGIREDGALLWNGYFSEVVYIDGAALAPTSFGEFDEDSGIWKPIKVSGLTFGNNGCYLDFQDSSALGNVVAGRTSVDFTATNLTAVDQSTDTCTNNFATLNPLNNYWAAVGLTVGNSVYTSNNSSEYYGVATSTIGVSKGKWYFEAKNSTNTNQGILGVTSRTQTGRSTWLGSTTQAYGYYSTGGVIRSSASDTSYGASYTANDIIGIYLDLDNNLMYVSDNGSLQNSGTGHSITAAASTDSGFYYLAVGDNSDSTQVWQCNFGGTSGFTISSAVTDDNGFGAFEYSPNITGDSVAKKFYALCSKNLAEFG